MLPSTFPFPKNPITNSSESCTCIKFLSMTKSLLCLIGLKVCRLSKKGKQDDWSLCLLNYTAILSDKFWHYNFFSIHPYWTKPRLYLSETGKKWIFILRSKTFWIYLMKKTNIYLLQHKSAKIYYVIIVINFFLVKLPK